MTSDQDKQRIVLAEARGLARPRENSEQSHTGAADYLALAAGKPL